MNLKTQYGLKVILTSIVYLAIGLIGLKLATINNNASPFWPATGFAIGILYGLGPRYAIAIFLGALMTNLSTGSPFTSVVIIAFGNMCEAILGAWILGKVFKNPEVSPQDEVIGIVLASLAGAVLSASIGVSGLVATNAIPLATFWTAWTTWYIGDAVGGIIFAPWVLMFFLKDRLHLTGMRKQSWSHAIGRILLSLATFAIVCRFVFFTTSGAPFVYLIFPTILLAQWLLGSWGGRAMALAMCISAIAAAFHRMGAFSFDGFNQNLISLQVFLGTLGLTALLLEAFVRLAPLKSVASVLMVSWIASGGVFYLSYTSIEHEYDSSFNNAIDDYVDAIRQRLQAHTSLLEGGEGLFTSSQKVERAEWKTFVKALRLKERYPGVLGMGMIQVVHPKNLKKFIAEERNDSAPEFSIKSLSDSLNPNTDHYVIKFIEPQGKGLGLDISTGEKRREGAELARDTGVATLTGQFQMVHDVKNRAGGFLLLPLYSGPRNTLEERRKNILGWIYSPFFYEEFLPAALNTSGTSNLDFVLFESQNPSAENMVANFSNLKVADILSRPARNIRFTHLNLGQREFTMAWILKASTQSSRTLILSWIAAAGALMALAFAWILISSITFRLRAERMVILKTRQLSEKQRLWQKLTESSPIGIFQASQSGELNFVNPRWRSLTGLSSHEAMGSGWLAAVHHKDRAIVEELWKKAVEEQISIDTEIRIQSITGEIRWVGWVVAPIVDENQSCTGFLGALVDQTERRIQARALEKERGRVAQSAKMASLGEMAGGIAHEINNPLTVILAKAVSLKNMNAETLNLQKVQQAGEKIEQTTDRIVKIIKGLRAFSRNADQDPPALISIKTIIEDTLSLCSEKIRMNSISLSLGGSLDTQVSCRPSQIAQVILNMMNNSVDAIKNLESPWIKIEGAIENGMLQISITDSGSGIPTQFHSRLMEPFFTTKEVGLGTGLGLSICRGLIESHGGKFWYDSSCPNTRFVFELPVETPSKAASAS